MARHLKLPVALCTEFQQTYFNRFPGIPLWHQRTKAELQSTGKLTTALGRERYFYSRLDDDATIREAVAFEPQSLIVDIINTGMLRLFQRFPQVLLTLQVHDSILTQLRPEDVELIPEVIKILTVPIEVRGRVMTIPVDGEFGWNWSKMNTKEENKGTPLYNPYGLRGLKKHGPAQDEILAARVLGLH
jgi:DNA polymerase I-like protein with 3'-5' exonuclease and polymerase domains